MAIVSAIDDTATRNRFILVMLRDLIRLETRPVWLTNIGCEWCSVICENHQSLRDWESPRPFGNRLPLL